MLGAEIFLRVLNKLDESGVLEDLILIGGWCLPVYSSYFKGSAEVPVKRTVDLDFLIPNPPRLKHKVNVADLLEELDFSIEYGLSENLTKFVHPDLEVEFLMNQKGRGTHDAVSIKDLSVTAVLLRYLSILESNILQVNYEGLSLRVPQPAAYTLHKYIISQRRTHEAKALKDMETAQAMTHFLLNNAEQRNKLKVIYSGLALNWKKTLLKILEKKHEELYVFLQG